MTTPVIALALLVTGHSIAVIAVRPIVRPAPIAAGRRTATTGRQRYTPAD